MEKAKVEQIRDKICDHMLATDLSKLTMYDLCAYINAYKSLAGESLFPGFGLGLGTSLCATSAQPLNTSKGEQ